MALVVVTRRTNKQIAAELNLSEMTLKAHRGQVMRKMKPASLPSLCGDRPVRVAEHNGVGDYYESRSDRFQES